MRRGNLRAGAPPDPHQISQFLCCLARAATKLISEFTIARVCTWITGPGNDSLFQSMQSPNKSSRLTSQADGPAGNKALALRIRNIKNQRLQIRSRSRTRPRSYRMGFAENHPACTLKYSAPDRLAGILLVDAKSTGRPHSIEIHYARATMK